MDFRLHSGFRFLNIVVIFFIFANLAFLNFWVFVEKQKEKAAVIVNTAVSEKSEPTASTCGEDCVKDIYESIYQATTSSTIKNTTAKESTTSTTSQTEQETIISIGPGTTMAEDWTDVSGLQVEIDTTKYAKIKKVVFEAYLRIPTGNQVAYARLFNVTDKHPVWFSEVSLEGGTPKLLTSQPITLDSGSKVYQVQMKTSLKFLTYLDSSRIRITTN